MLIIDCPETFLGVVIEKLGGRKGKMAKMVNHGSGRVRLEFHVPTRGLIGLRSEMLTDTRGTAIMNSLFHGYIAVAGRYSDAADGFARGGPGREGDRLCDLESPGARRDFHYAGDGSLRGHDRRRECARSVDLDVNIVKEKKLTNMRASTADEAIRLVSPRILNLEQAIEFIRDDEFVEVDAAIDPAAEENPPGE